MVWKCLSTDFDQICHWAAIASNETINNRKNNLVKISKKQSKLMKEKPKFLWNAAGYEIKDYCNAYRPICLFLVQQPPVGHGLLIHEVSRSHTTTHHIR